MMPEDNHKPNRPEPTPAEIERLLEIELMQKRAAWQQAKARHSTVRLLSFFFFLLVIAAALFGYFVFFSPDRVQELKSTSSQSASPTPSLSESNR